MLLERKDVDVNALHDFHGPLLHMTAEADSEEFAVALLKREDLNGI